MRVLMVSKACLVGAYQRKLEEIARHDDVELTVVVPPSWRDERGELLLERTFTEGYDLLVEPIRLNGSYHTHYYPRLRRTIARTRPDLIHIDEEPYNLATGHATWLARRAGARTLFFSWQNINRRYPLPFRWVERYVLRHADYAIVGNQASAQVWRDKGHCGPLAVIPQFGVDPEIFKPAQGDPACGDPEPGFPVEFPHLTPGETDKAPGRGFIVGFVGRLVFEKGCDLLLEAVAALPGQWQLVFCGGGPERERLGRMARELKVSDRVSFAGQIPSTQMPAHYHRLDALALPSRTRPNWKEQFGRALVEAMSCGIPVIGSTCGEIPNVIGDAGLVFQENDADELRRHLLHLQQRPELRRELGQLGRRRVLERYTQAQVAAQTVRVYREVMQET
jgi:glycosyltransferase involved in cell wall biosynthesis